MIANFGHVTRNDSRRFAELMKSVLDIDHDALKAQYEMASKLSEHLSDKDYETFTGLLHLLEEMLK